jgi:hypothetical protein
VGVQHERDEMGMTGWVGLGGRLGGGSGLRRMILCIIGVCGRVLGGCCEGREGDVRGREGMR